MLDNKKVTVCKCYDQEESGFFSLRLSSNKHFGHNIGMVENTHEEGNADFVIKYWDIRFSNLCNLACRSCGTWFSSVTGMKIIKNLQAVHHNMQNNESGKKQ